MFLSAAVPALVLVALVVAGCGVRRAAGNAAGGQTAAKAADAGSMAGNAAAGLTAEGMSGNSGQVTYSVQKIWDNGTHSAFTSLVKFGGRYYCTFREGYSHIFDPGGKAEGKIRVLESEDGNSWSSVLCFGMEGIDCRDPKLSVTPDGRIMLSFGGSVYRERKLISQQGYVTFSEDGKAFSEPEKIVLDPDTGNDTDWLWRVTWHEDEGYGVCYGSGSAGRTLVLYKTLDGIRYGKVKAFDINGFPNEATVRFDEDGTMFMLLRRDADDKMGYWGSSRPPYTDWDFKPMALQVGGPDFLVMEDGSVIAGTRSYAIKNHCKTILLRGDREGDFQEVFTLPSDGDTSYPGMLVEDGMLWVSYYSTAGTPGKASIFLAKIPLSALRQVGDFKPGG